MRPAVRLGVIILVLAFVLSLFGGSSDRSQPTVVLRHPSTLFPMAASGLHNIESRIHGWMDAGKAGYQERIPDVDPTPSPPR